MKGGRDAAKARKRNGAVFGIYKLWSGLTTKGKPTLGGPSEA
jgi:hypothetical protein